MTINQMVSATVGTLCLAGVAGSAQATVSYNNNITPIIGSGNSSTGWTTATDNGLSLSLRAQYNNTTTHLPSNLTPNNGAGTFTFAASSSSLAIWDFWFDVNPGSTVTTGDIFTLSVWSNLNPTPKSSQISLHVPADNGVSGTEYMTAEDIGFPFIGYDPTVADTYHFTLTAQAATGAQLDSVSMTVVNGSSVPEPSTVAAGALLLLPLGVSALRMFRRNRVA